MKNLGLFILLLIVIVSLYLGCQNTQKESLTNSNVCNSKNGTPFPQINNLLKTVLGTAGPAGMVVNTVIQKIEGYCCQSPENLEKCKQLEQKVASGAVKGIDGIIDFLGSEFHHVFADVCDFKIPFTHIHPLEKLSFCKKLTGSSDTDHPNLKGTLPPPGPKSPPPGAQSPSSLCCTGWQQTLNCQGHGPLDTSSAFLKESTHGSHKCDVPLTSGVSGFCTCKDGSKKYFNCGELGGKGQPTNCDDACKGVTCKPKAPDTTHPATHPLLGTVSTPMLGSGRWSTPLPTKNAKFLNN